VHYVVNGNDIRIVEQSTGRIFEDRSWQSGLHQAIEAKEGVSITPESIPLAQITRQRFYRLYAHLCGMTGTTANCEPELRSIYQLSIQKIPLRIPSKRIFWPTQIFENSDLKWRSIASSIAQVSATGRPVLIGTRTILESQVLAELLSGAQVDFQLLNGKQDADEAAVVSDAGKRGRITIATNLAGRGTDIKLDPKVKNAGGLHVIVSECHASYRTDRQLIGRCARQGDPGSCQTFVSADDWLFTRYAPWFADALCWLAKQSDNRYDVDSKIRKIQANIEREQYGFRSQLLRQNQNRHKIFRQATP
ncbi:MAG: preprotein translocase subunit SecA, partial [Planctomycetota bacterium]